MIIMKFGGSSVANAKNINKVIDIVLESQKESDGLVVVVSALGGVTDELIKIANLAAAHDEKYKRDFQKLCERHNQVKSELVKKENKEINKKYEELSRVLGEVFEFGELSSLFSDSIMSFGEQLSAYIISEAIKSRGVSCGFIDSRTLIKTDDNFGEADVDIETSYKLISNYFKNKKTLSVMGGFIASTRDGTTTTLGRGGSDYTASLVGAALHASVVEIWTDVDGLMTADPRKVESAHTIPQISYEEAEKMALSGAKVIHPKTMKPARLKNIPIYIKNTFNPKGNGTKIR